jgi:small-conductance mechanosensitive channel
MGDARAGKLRFDAEGITIPYPQRDVHLFKRCNRQGDSAMKQPIRHFLRIYYAC